MKNVTENNKIIAAFMGDYDFTHTEGGLPIGDFSNCWDLLMPVVEKIEDILLNTDNSFNVTIGCGLDCTIQDDYGVLIEINTCEQTKIKTVFKAIVEFIKWYNEQK